MSGDDPQIEMLQKQCDGLFEVAMNNAEAVLIEEYKRKRLERALELRDQFLVDKGLWNEFVSTLPMKPDKQDMIMDLLEPISDINMFNGIDVFHIMSARIKAILGDT